MARLKIEEIVLMSVSAFFLIWLIALGFSYNDAKVIFEKGFASLSLLMGLLAKGMIIFLILIVWLQIKNKSNQWLSLIRASFFVLVASLMATLMSGAIQQATQDRLINDQLLALDKTLSSQYPFFWLHSPANNLKEVFDFFSPAIIYSSLSLAAVMVFAAIVFYFSENKKLFKGYIMSVFIVLTMSALFWYFFPANSPANYLLRNTSQNFEASLSQAMQNFQPNNSVMLYQTKSWEMQKNSLPATTMPSMHWAWSIIVVYYFFKKEKKTIALSSVWLGLNLFGTIYLGNHYLIDGLAALPLVILSLYLANFFIKIKPDPNQ